MDTSYDYRFSGLKRLYGNKAMDKIKNSHIAIIGIGGVGSWVAEALARSGVNEITLIDLDDLCTSNINRQIHALSETVGQMKTEIMKKRIHSINPECTVHEIQAFYSEKNADTILETKYDYIVDAIDSFEAKIHLIVECRKRKLPLFVCGGAGGRKDPTKIKIDDLSDSYNDKLLARVRKRLRTEHNFPRNRKFHIPCVYSFERAVYPSPDGETCHKPISAADTRLDCQTGFGTASFITASFGMFAASYILDEITRDNF